MGVNKVCSNVDGFESSVDVRCAHLVEGECNSNLRLAAEIFHRVHLEDSEKKRKSFLVVLPDDFKASEDAWIEVLVVCHW